MARRKKEKRTFRYECTITNKRYTVTQKAENPDELMSVEAYYQMHPENDDRPKVVKKSLGLLEGDE